MSDAEQIEQLVKYQGRDRVVHFTDFMLEKLSASTTKTKKFKSCFTEFENRMGGIETGEIVVITGHRKEGKTLFAESWLKSMMVADPSAKSLILSYEVPIDRILDKYIPEENMPIYVPMNLEAMNFKWLEDRCKEAKYKFNCKIVMIDHLHFMVDMATQQNMSLNIGGFMRNLKHKISIGLNMGVVLIAHQGQPKEGKEASVDTIRDSSFISQECDAVVVVSRRKNYDNVEMKDLRDKVGDVANLVLPPADSIPDDEYSSNLAIVKIECHRRTGTYRWKKLFQKRGHWMEEV